MPLIGAAQTTISTGSIQGTISDPTGALVAGAKIMVVSQDTGQVLNLTTTSDGLYTSGALAAGHYIVRVQYPGFKTADRSLVVQVGVTSSANITLQVGEASETVTVHESEVSVNTEQAAIQGVLTTQEIENLPINGRDFVDLAQLEPGIQNMNTSGSFGGRLGHGGISVGGRYTESTRVEVDGLDMSDDTGTTLANISTSSIQEFSIEQSTMDPSSETTNSGAVNIVTRRGSNAFHGEGLYLFRDRSLSADSVGGISLPYQRQDFAGNLGGPIVKDKLFFFVNGERYKQDLGFPVVVPPPLTIGSGVATEPLRESMLQGRLDYNLSKGTLFYRFAYDNSHIVGGMAPSTELDVDNTPAHAVGADFSSGHFTHSVRFGYVKNVELLQNFPQPNYYNPLPQVALQISDFDSGINTTVPTALYRSQKQIRYDGSRIFAAHILRYGVSYTRLMSGEFSNTEDLGPLLGGIDDAATEAFANNSCGPGNPCFPGGVNNPLNYPLGGGGGFYLGNGQGFVTEITGFGLPAGANPPDNRIQWYAGDTWKIKPNLTVNYSLHYVHDTGITNSDIAPLPCSAINTANFSPAPPPCTGNILDMWGPGLSARPPEPALNFAPQAGIAWDISKKGKTVLRAGASKVFSTTAPGASGRKFFLPTGLFNQQPGFCPSGNVIFPAPGGGTQTITRTPPTAAHPNGLDIATQVCNPENASGGFTPGFVMGTVAADLVALQNEYQAATVAAGPQSNASFLGNTLYPNGIDAPNYKTPYSYQMNIGVQHEIRPGVVVSADYIRNISLRYPMTIDANHVGDSRYLNSTTAINAINATLSQCGVASINAGISAPCPSGNFVDANGNPRSLYIEDFAGNGLASNNQFLGVGVPPSLVGLTPNQAGAFGGINPNLGQGLFNYPIGRSNYNALQVVLREQKERPLPYIKNMYLQCSYSLSRYASPLIFAGGDDQDSRSVTGGAGAGAYSSTAAGGALNYRNPVSNFGPTAFDRTHQFSVGTTVDFAKPLRVALIGHVYSPLSQSLTLVNQGRAGEIFHTDFNGDGTTGDLLPGTHPGSFMRAVKPGDETAVLEHYNNTIAGTILPAGQALINAGLFTNAQLIALGAVADSVPLGPDPNNRAGLGWLKTVDLKLSAPIKVGEKLTLEPSAGAYNLFNFANFNVDPTARWSSALRGTQGSVDGTPNTTAALNEFRATQGASMFGLGIARQFEFGMKFVF
ncbi:MAG: carboxypeptidase regulatory-like domain-containing protein [Candidatus Sulfotelmatobacter sp.]